MDNLPQWNEMLIKLNRDKFLPISLVATSESLKEARDGAAAPSKQVVYTSFSALRRPN